MLNAVFLKIKEKLSQRWVKIGLLLAIIGPGIITGQVDNDAGGIATYSIAGAKFGYSMLWTLIPITILLVYTMNITTKAGIVTRLGLAELIREKFRIKLTLFVLALVLISNMGTTISEFSGISSSIYILGKNIGGNHLMWTTILPIIGVILAGIIAWFVVVKGSYKSIEKLFLTMALFYITYIISAFLAGPDWKEAFRGLFIPTLKFDSAFLFTTVGVVGTTVAPWMYFYLQSTAIEKGIKKEDLKYSQIDTTVGGIFTDIFSFFMIVACAATIFTHNLPINNVEDIGVSLAPLAGHYSAYLFAFGLLNASIFGAFILPLSTAYIICEALGFELGMNKKFSEAPIFYGIFTVILIIGVITVAIPGMPLLMIMRTSQVANGIVLPFFLYFLVKLAEDKGLMGEYATRGFWRIFGWTSVVVLTVLNAALLIAPFIVRADL
ncbi:divalent metal cation transporter [Candidatus Peregrinibacteria bacterium]|nr:divalent metal cation transporter [Candidatus Peregrinibacteria bacterium]